MTHPTSTATSDATSRNRHHDPYLTCKYQKFRSFSTKFSKSFLDGNPPSSSSSTSSNDANINSVNPDIKLQCLDKVKPDVENKSPAINGTSQLTADKLNEYNLRHDITQENAAPLTIAVGGASGSHLGPTSSSSTKLRK